MNHFLILFRLAEPQSDMNHISNAGSPARMSSILPGRVLLRRDHESQGSSQRNALLSQSSFPLVCPFSCRIVCLLDAIRKSTKYGQTEDWAKELCDLLRVRECIQTRRGLGKFLRASVECLSSCVFLMPGMYPTFQKNLFARYVPNAAGSWPSV